MQIFNYVTSTLSNIQSVTRNTEKQKKRKKKKKCDWNQEEKFQQIQVQKCQINRISR